MNRKLVYVLLIAAGLSGCGSPKPAPKAPDTPTFAAKHVLNTLRGHYAGWKDAPSGPKIADAAFIQQLFKERFDITLPKESHAMRIVGEPILQTVLRPGDLVFFHDGKRAQHIGVYLDKGCFMHAQKEEGVIISSLQDPMWKKRFAQARRILR